MRCSRYLSPLVFIGLGILGVGLIVHIVGMATPEWSCDSSKDDVCYGPFHTCPPAQGCDPIGAGQDPNVEAVRAMTMIGTLVALVAFFAGLALVLLGVRGKMIPALAPTILATSVISFVFIIIGVIVWGADVHEEFTEHDIGYSLALTVVGCSMVLCGGILLFLGGREILPEKEEKTPQNANGAY